ncbi:xylose isomerase [Halobacteriales archaeon QS_1_68_17]|nr:MAG: xylose isomerase [Halobacteriales archaeon QS_1_68_17]
MGLGYTTIMYDADAVADGIADVGACRYDGVEIGLEKVRAVGPDRLADRLDEHDLDLYCVMSEWLTDADAVDRIVEAAPTVADLGAEFYGILPPQRGRQDEATLERWLADICGAAADAGLRPVLHHHGATMVERPAEIESWLDRAPDDLELLFDTAHYYPYGEAYPDGDVTGGIERFADDTAYVHVKDVDPPAGFDDHTAALTAGEFHLDDVINYFRAFTDLGAGVIDFAAVREALSAAGYDGHVTVEIENETELPLVHAKQNFDYWTRLADDA